MASTERDEQSIVLPISNDAEILSPLPDANGGSVSGCVGSVSDLRDMSLETTAPSPAAERREWRAGAWAALWRSRALWLGGIALGLGCYAQFLIVTQQVVDGATRWYAAAVLLLICAWAGTYKNKTCLLAPEPTSGPAAPLEFAAPPARLRGFRSRRSWTTLARQPMMVRYLVAGAALLLNLASVSVLRANDYDSALGGVGWLLSLGILLLACVGHRPAPLSSADAGHIFEIGQAQGYGEHQDAADQRRFPPPGQARQPRGKEVVVRARQQRGTAAGRG
jgi:hypothetical protein